MNNKDETLKILIGMKMCEKLLFEIYNDFSSRFREYHDFWQDISIDENTHALMVDTFISLYKSKNILFDHRSFSLTMIEKDIDKIKLFKSKIIKTDISLSEALEFALKAENSIIEKDLYHYQDDDPPDFKKLLITLYEDSQKHRHKIKNLYNKIKEEKSD